MSTAVKITQKGQVTIPRKIREKLGSEVIEFNIVKDQIIIRPLASVAGSLSAYGKKESIPFTEAREKAWDEISREKYGKKTGRR
jgi:AbrB family looped-hinge helix DNA binding protein